MVASFPAGASANHLTAWDPESRSSKAPVTSISSISILALPILQSRGHTKKNFPRLPPNHQAHHGAHTQQDRQGYPSITAMPAIGAWGQRGISPNRGKMLTNFLPTDEGTSIPTCRVLQWFGKRLRWQKIRPLYPAKPSQISKIWRLFTPACPLTPL